MAQARSLIERVASLEGVLAVVVGVGAIIYPIGFIQLVARIGFGATNVFSSAWLAASLMPAVRVAGEGVHALAGLWGMFIIFAASLVIYRRWQISEHTSLSDYLKVFTARKWVLALVLVILAAGVIVGLVSEHGTWQTAVEGVITFVVAQIYSVLLLTHRARRVVAQFALVTGLFYLSTSINVVLEASAHHDAGLPHVQIGSDDGRLISHSDGYWYILTSSGEIRAVPDSQATAVIKP